MNLTEIKVVVQRMLADGTLPRHRPGIAGTGRILMTGGSALPDPCVVCGQGPTQYRYGDPSGPGLAFDEACHRVWEAEITSR